MAARPVLIASLMGDNKPETKIWLKIRDLVEASLPGRFVFNIVTNVALGGEKDVNKGLRLGAIQGSLSTLSALSAWAPESQLFDMPFLFRDAGHVRATVASKTGEALKVKLEGGRFMVGDYVNYGARHLLAKEQLTRPADVANGCVSSKARFMRRYGRVLALSLSVCRLRKPTMRWPPASSMPWT